MNSFRTFGTFIITFFDTLTLFSLALHHLARAGVERTVVVEEKSRAAAALSAFENKSNVAMRLEEIQSQHDTVNATSLQEAEDFLNAYDAKRKGDVAPIPVRTQRVARGRKS